MIVRSRNPAEPLVSAQGDAGQPGEQSCPYAVLFPLRNYMQLCSPGLPSRATLLTCNGFLNLQLGNKSLVLVADFSHSLWLYLRFSCALGEKRVWM